jgi:phenylacetate-CoA ligase
MINKIIESIVYKKSDKVCNLSDVLEYAVRNTNYYTNFNFRELSSFPILTKDIIREHFEDLKSKDISSRKWWMNTSGGSTGEPVKFIQDKEYLQYSRYITYQQKKKIGYTFGDTFIKLWGDEKEILNNNQSFKNKIINKIKNITFLNSFNMTQENMFKFVNEINNKKPQLIVAYAQAMYELARFVEQNNLKVQNIKAIMTSAGTLYPFMRELIEKKFNTKVYNRYGSREVGNIACEEPNIDGLVISDGVYIEIVDENGDLCKDGVEGDILVTSLINYAMPLIRYKIGDRGVLNTTRYDFPILEKVTGRGMETFKTIDSRVIPAEYFIHIIGVVFNKENSWIKKFQIIQKKYDLIEIKIVKFFDESDDDMNNIINGVKKVMGNGCEVNFTFVDEIQSLKSGKFLYTICEINK